MENIMNTKTSINKSEVQIFNSERFGRIRTVVGSDGEPWFVAKDVAAALGYSGTNMSNTCRAVPDEWKGSHPMTTLGGKQRIFCLSEQGLYFFLARSDKPKALPFQKWLAGDVLPVIRKRGLYATPQTAEAILNDPDNLIKILETLKAEREARVTLEKRVEEDAPKVEFAENIEQSKNTIQVGEMAKIIKQSTGYDTGQRRLFEKLRDMGFLMKEGPQYNYPTQKSINLGLMKIRETCFRADNGAFYTQRSPMITGRGQIFFINMFKKIQTRKGAKHSHTLNT
jgi:anti-repressor protein